MAKSITIKSIRDATHLTFRDVTAESLTAEVESSHFSALVIASTFHVGPPLEMFDEMAKEWRVRGQS